MRITIQKDGAGYLARVTERDDIYAFGFTEEEARAELLNVIEMLIDVHSEQIDVEKKVREELRKNGPLCHAV